MKLTFWEKETSDGLLKCQIAELLNLYRKEESNYVRRGIGRQLARLVGDGATAGSARAWLDSKCEELDKREHKDYDETNPLKT